MSPDGASVHPRLELDEYLSLPVRLSIVAALAKVDEAEFGVVRDIIEVSDPVLSKQVSVLENAGYVNAKKGYVGRRPRTWLSLTNDGRAALGRHLTALHALIRDL
ncbi:DNA-binding MarR family transcriptional regulator [Arthrobacter ginsengisoli]|uniref:DNA-binding MarR family transcriptional regulator n=1 Tax=Arthrobacter ginsengisoli TaxID=1356565 RepID=A0ABU1U9R5_9MICC|nr:transcriptional regulator [Arthrobacter ginsengisoli]MDR7081927.1 DNA-binding MarR family transcriptional regulator [Arthrobacter ginsengisoli]